MEATPSRVLGDLVLIVRVVAWEAAVFALDAFTLFVMLRAVGSPTGFAPAFACFLIASVFATLMVVPGGLGTFEGASVAMLHLFGVPLAAALAATCCCAVSPSGCRCCRGYGSPAGKWPRVKTDRTGRRSGEWKQRLAAWWSLPAEELIRLLQTTPLGLSAAEAAARRQ